MVYFCRMSTSGRESAARTSRGTRRNPRLASAICPYRSTGRRNNRLRGDLDRGRPSGNQKISPEARI